MALFNPLKTSAQLATIAKLVVVLWIACWVTNTNANQQFEIDDELRALLKNAVTENNSFVDRFDAEVWLLSKTKAISRFIDDTEQGIKLLRLIHHYATQAGVQPELVLAVIEIESGFDSYALSHAGAQGMMQVMPFWKKEIGRTEDNLIHLETNLKYGCTILKHYIDRSNGKIADALARYNGSYGSYRYSEKVLDVFYDYWR